MWARVVAALGQLAPRQMEPVQMAAEMAAEMTAEMTAVAVPPLPLPSYLFDFQPKAKRALVLLWPDLTRLYCVSVQFPCPFQSSSYSSCAESFCVGSLVLHQMPIASQTGIVDCYRHRAWSLR